MEPENQTQVKNLAEDAERDKVPRSDIIVVLGASDLDGAVISAETVTSGDPSFSGPLAGVSLGLPVYHILEPEIQAAVPEDVYEENVGIWALAVEPEKIDKILQEFKAIREKTSASAQQRLASA
jgi:betaine reductase